MARSFIYSFSWRNFALVLHALTFLMFVPVNVLGQSGSPISLQIYQPSADGVLKRNFWTTISGAAASPNGIRQVTYYIDDKRHCVVKKSPYNCSYKTSNKDGRYKLTATAEDRSGLSLTQVRYFYVGTSQPTPVEPAATIGVVSATPQTLVPGEQTRLSTVVNVNTTGTYHLQMQVRNSSNQVVGGVYRENISLNTGQGYTFQGDWVTTANTPTGTYNVSVGVFTSDWKTLLWRDNQVSVTVNEQATTPPPTPPPGGSNPIVETPELPGYSIYFADEFNNIHNGSPDHSVWDYDVNYQRNGEAQCYTENRRENVRVEERVVDGSLNGVLVLEARKENWSCPYAGGKVFSYTSGSIMTRKKSWGQILVDMPHGRYEIRAKVPDTGSGTWPAIWLLGDSNLGGWPKSGEIDIMEQYGSETARGRYKFHATLHRDGKARPWPTELGTGFTGMGHTLTINEKPGARFRVFALEWTPTSLEFFVDGVRVTKRTILWDQKFEDHLGFFRDQIANSYDDLGWPYGRPSSQNSKWYMLLNLALQGGTTTDASQFDRGPVEFVVDYVRIYKKD